ncbi:protease adaptor protein RcdA [Phenylobacterium sp.]|uniref:protease adaptor protein RcdA n=1 Tax=Phenylobacterium sp. TaxID=1871053 RepID=UPI002FDABECF
MSEMTAQAKPWRPDVIADFARSELFDRTFQEGMELVEETAAYLDGAGRQESKRLDRTAALAYAAESMRLTTRLMQVASWLLVQRAVREGDMAPEAACEERYRLAAEMAGAPAAAADILPAGLVDLMERSERLFERVRHLDRRMYVDVAEDAAPNPVLSQFDRLRSAFGAA